MSSKRPIYLKPVKLHVLSSIPLKSSIVQRIVVTLHHFQFSKNIIPGLLLWNGGFMMLRKMAILVILFDLDRQEHSRAIKVILTIQVADGKIRF